MLATRFLFILALSFLVSCSQSQESVSQEPVSQESVPQESVPQESVSQEWVNVGSLILSIEKSSPNKVRDIPYRLFDLHTKAGKFKKTIDTLDLTLEIQSGHANGKRVLISVKRCYMPQVRAGLPTVQCDAEDGSIVFLSGDTQARSKLLHLENEQRAKAVGRVLGLFGNFPIVEIL